MKTKISALQLYLMLFLSRVIVSITINVQTVGGSNLIESIFSSLGLFLYLTVFSLPLFVLHKSHPEVFFEWMSSLGGADPAGCAVCEDAVSAADTAQKAGSCVIGIADRTSAADKPEMRRICSQFVPRWDMLDWTRV